MVFVYLVDCVGVRFVVGVVIMCIRLLLVRKLLLVMMMWLLGLSLVRILMCLFRC